jgi:Tfp pilus assembly PilM family ATPase
MAYRKRVPLPIGIHLNADAVFMAQLEQGDTGLSVVSKAAKHFTSVPTAASNSSTPSEAMGGSDVATMDDSRYDEAREFIRDRIANDGFHGKDVVLSLPSECLVIQHVRVLPLPMEELTGVLPGELQGKLPFDPRKAVLRYIVAGQVSENGETKQDVIVLAVRREVIETAVGSITKLGLQVVGVGVEPCCMCYPYTFAASRTVPTAEGPPGLMLVYLGPRTTHVGIIRGTETAFVKGIELGTDHLVEALAAARTVTPQQIAVLRDQWQKANKPEELNEAVAAYNSIQWNLGHIVDEIQSCMRYYMSLARGARIERLVFLGPESQDKALVRVLGAHLSLTCEMGNPVEVVTGTASDAMGPEMAVAVGLSLFGAQ